MDKEIIDHIRRSAESMIKDWIEANPNQQVPPSVGHWLIQLCDYVNELQCQVNHCRAVDT